MDLCRVLCPRKVKQPDKYEILGARDSPRQPSGLGMTALIWRCGRQAIPDAEREIVKGETSALAGIWK